MSVPAVDELLDFSGQIAIVTGRGSGLGAGIALRFAEAGAAIVVHYNTSAAGAQKVVAQIESLGESAIAVQADVSKRADVDRLFADTIGTFGHLDVLINNAGTYPLSSLVEMSDNEWDLVVDANLRSVFLCTQAAARQMIAQGDGGAIVNIASIEAENPAPMHSHYNAAKGGVVMHTRSAAYELGRYGIRVNVVSPVLYGEKALKTHGPRGWTAGKKQLRSPDWVNPTTLPTRACFLRLRRPAG